MKVTEPEDTLPYRALYRATIDEAVGGAGALMTRLVAHVRSALREAESQARERRERDHLTNSRRLLNQHEATLAQRFADELLNAFARQSSFDRVVPSSGGLQFDQVGQMDDAQLRQSLETARVQHAVQQVADTALTELNRLICTMLGLADVRLERNPLRPSVYVEAVTAALSHLPVPSTARLAWIGMMSRALGQELDIYYRSLCEDLRERGVGVSGGARVVSTARAAPQAAQEPVVVTLEKLRRLLADAPRRAEPAAAMQFESEPAAPSNDSEFGSSQIEPTAFRATVPAAFDALRDMHQVDAVVRRLQDRHEPLATPVHSHQVLEQLRVSAQGLEQALGLEVVAMMVDNIAHDPRLLGPVQDLVLALEPALLQLAMVDPRFFSHRQHPARRLLHEITHRSIAFESVDSRGFSGFMEPLREALAPLARDTIETAEPFDRALERLSALLDDPSGRAQRQLSRAVAALHQAEQRNTLAATIVAEVQDRADTQQVPDLVRDFLCGPWAQVVAHARINDSSGAMDPGDYAQTIEDLLWTMQPGQLRHHREGVRELVPLLQARLRSGLGSIDMAEAQVARLFVLLDELLAATQDMAGAGGKPTAMDATEALAKYAPMRDSLWLAPTEAQLSGFIDLSSVVQPLAPAGGADALELGVWVALLADGGWTRTRLTWASPNGTLMLFVDALGFMQSLSRRSCEQLFSAGHLRIISSDPVEDALDAVARAAVRNSVDIRF